MRKARYKNTGKYNPTADDSWSSTSKYAAKKTVFVSSMSDLEKCVGHLVGIKFKCVECGCIEYTPRFRKENIDSISQFLCKRCKHRLMSTSHPEWQAEGLKAYKAKTGYDNPMDDPNVQRKIKESFIANNGSAKLSERMRRYHVEHPEWYHNKRIFFYGMYFDSSWELALWIYAKDHGELIIREPFIIPYIDGSGSHTIPDFWYKDKLVEVKGHHLSKSNPDGSVSLINAYDPNDHSGEVKMNTLAAYNCDIYRRHQMYQYLAYVWKTYGEGYMRQFYNSNVLNPSFSTPLETRSSDKSYYSRPVVVGKGVSPFDYNIKNEKYAPVTGKGISPFDIRPTTPVLINEQSVTVATENGE